MTSRTEHFRYGFIAIITAAALLAGIGLTVSMRNMRMESEIAEYQTEIDLAAECISGELSLFFERLYNAGGAVLHGLRYSSREGAIASIQSPYILSQFRALSHGTGAAFLNYDGTVFLPVMGAVQNDFADSGFPPFQDVAFRHIGDSSGMFRSRSGEDYLVHVRRVDGIPWMAETVFVTQVPVHFLEGVVRGAAGYKFATRTALLDHSGRIKILADTVTFPGSSEWEIPEHLAAEAVSSGGTKRIGGDDFIASSRQIRGFPATILILAERKEVEEIIRKELGLFSFINIPVSALIGLLGALVFEFFRVLGERKRSGDEIREANQMLEKRVRERTVQLETVNQELEAFAYSVSHDLRAPLRAIDGYSRFLEEDYQGILDDEGNRLLHVIRSSTTKMDELISALLNLSKVSRNELTFSRIDMAGMANSIYHEIASGEVRETFEMIIHPMPYAWGDSSLMRQVWYNLIENAIKYSMKSARRKIEIGAGKEGEHTVYFIRDWGTGFNREYVSKIFGVFQRLHSAEEFEGTGIGLALVQRILHRHGGDIRAESVLNEGATFHFHLLQKGGQGEE